MAPTSAPLPSDPGDDVRFAALALALLVAWATVSSPGPWAAVIPVDLGVREHRVAVNTAPVGELMALPGVGRVLADRIAEYRAGARFDGPPDLERVHGIGPVLVRRLAPYVTCESPPE